MAKKIADVNVGSDQRDLNLLDSQQLRESNIAHSQALFRTQHQLAQTMSRAKALRNPAPLNLPNQAFTIRELETINPAMDPEDVRVHLANEISLHRVEYFPQSRNNELASEVPMFFMYRLAQHPVLSAP